MFLPVKQAECSKVLNRIMGMVQTILDYSVQTLVQEFDMKELMELVDKDLRLLLKKKNIQSDIQELFRMTYTERMEADWAFSRIRSANGT